MDEKNNIDNNEIHIEQINPRKELNDLEKTAILQFKIDKEEELSKTTQFRLLNNKNSNDSNQGLDLPKKAVSLTDTIKLKISDLRDAIEEKENIELPVLKTKRSLYDTVIIKLDDLINNKKALKGYYSHKVTNMEETKKFKKRFYLLKPKNITKNKDFKLNIESEDFGRQLYNLNRFALTYLSSNRPKKIRKYNEASRLKRIERIHISKDSYLKYQKKLQKFAINKLYYRFAPKESKKYKLYRNCVIFSSLVFFVTSGIIINWFVQGVTINNLSNALIESAPIKEIEHKELYNMENYSEDAVDDNGESVNNDSNNKNLYWQYINTPLSSVDFSDLLKQNKDTVGWLIVNDTNVNYPVVQTSDNEYYLKHSFDRTTNSAGWVYADYRNNFNNFNRNTVIYAHGRKDKVMFGSLTKTLDEKWYTKPENQIIQFSTLKYNTMWQIFAVYKFKAESYYITTEFSSDESYEKFLNTMKSRSIHNFNVPLTKDDKLLTLSTCYNDMGVRLVVQAKLIKIRERGTPYN